MKSGLSIRGVVAKVDRMLGRITMYRLLLVWLLVLLGAGMVFGLLGWMPYSALDILVSTAFLVAVSLITNMVFAKVFGAAPASDSVYVTALILALLITPTAPFSQLPLLAWAAFLANASKYLLAWRRRHLFNPAALAVVITSLFLGQSASWWVGSLPMLPLVLLGGVLVVRQIRRFDLVWSFFMAVMVTLLGFGIFGGTDLALVAKQVALYSPMFFFAFVMLTEPLTAPATRGLQMVYGALVGVLFVPLVHFGSFYTSPEIALVVGNLFAYLTGPKTNPQLKLKGAEMLSTDTYEFVFESDAPFSFAPGQYMEWTLPHSRQDSRGNRRFFTLSSSPNHREVRMGVKFYPKPSTFKKRLLAMQPGESIAVCHLAGDFILPRDRREKLAFIAGGIGITPFASMIRHMLDTKDRRDAVMLDANWREDDISYNALLREARDRLGLRTVHALSATDCVRQDWEGCVGFVDSKMVREIMPDFRERTFYISGPPAMVSAAKRAVTELGVKSSRIRTDYFPGFA
jgi:ferredoxin-NADP reductase/Na+-translocating ferredoxin:NAD+ oxidoreductase RnfD subunit